ncbi:MAG: hypothetical protein WCL06_11390, partial [Bacteroidota bacterium]
MSKFFTFLFLILGFSAVGQGLLNNGAYIVVSASTYVTINGATGNFKNQNSGTSAVTDFKGDLLLQGNFTNNATLNCT